MESYKQLRNFAKVTGINKISKFHFHRLSLKQTHMKKILTILGISVCILVMSACSNSYVEQDPVNVQETTQAYADLQTNIKGLNSAHENPQTRGFLGRLFKKILNVFVTDCIGAVKGAIQGHNIWQSAQGASLATARNNIDSSITSDMPNTCLKSYTSELDTTVTQTLQPKPVALHNLILTGDSATSNVNDSIGYFHNFIIYSTLEKNNDLNYWKGVSNYACVLELNKEIINTIPTTTYNDTIVSAETLKFCDFIGNKSAECQDYKELISACSTQYPELKDMLDTTSGFFEGMELVTTDEEWEQYCKDVIKLITRSDIPEADKNALKMGVSVGYASSKLWKFEE